MKAVRLWPHQEDAVQAAYGALAGGRAQVVMAMGRARPSSGRPPRNQGNFVVFGDGAARLHALIGEPQAGEKAELAVVAVETENLRSDAVRDEAFER